MATGSLSLRYVNTYKKPMTEGATVGEGESDQVIDAVWLKGLVFQIAMVLERFPVELGDTDRATLERAGMAVGRLVRRFETAA